MIFGLLASKVTVPTLVVCSSSRSHVLEGSFGFQRFSLSARHDVWVHCVFLIVGLGMAFESSF